MKEPPTAAQAPVILGGRVMLEVVGESYYQDALWRCVGGDKGERVRHPVHAVLVHDPTNPYDSGAIQVLIDGEPVGHLARLDAAAYLPGLQALTERYGRPIGLRGTVVGGGSGRDGRGMLGVFLDHDPADFGLRSTPMAYVGRVARGRPEVVKTGVGELSWRSRLSGNQSQDIVVLRRLLAEEPDPIDRHFMFNELSDRLYKGRDAFASALDEFDSICDQHQREMEVIRPALLEEFGRLPVVPMYRQAAIRNQKARDWEGVARWAERGLAFYGTDADRTDSVEDLRKRLVRAKAKLKGSISHDPDGRAPGQPTT